MQREQFYWHSPRTGRDMGVVVYGHWGPPLLTFPTSGGDEWEYDRQGLIDALAEPIDAGRVKIFSINTNHRDAFANRRAHPRHRSWMQRQYDAYVAEEVFPFIRHHCRDSQIGISTMGASLGAYHALNTLLKHPDAVKRCFALSGVYDMQQFMDGDYDDNFYFNNPVDYAAGISDGWTLNHLRSCDIHISTGTGPWERAEESYRMSRILWDRGIWHSLDDWGPMGGHDWPYWRYQMVEYLKGL